VGSTPAGEELLVGEEGVLFEIEARRWRSRSAVRVWVAREVRRANEAEFRMRSGAGEETDWIGDAA
jgi:hypothetical protein